MTSEEREILAFNDGEEQFNPIESDPRQPRLPRLTRQFRCFILTTRLQTTKSNINRLRRHGRK